MDYWLRTATDLRSENLSEPQRVERLRALVDVSKRDDASLKVILSELAERLVRAKQGLLIDDPYRGAVQSRLSTERNQEKIRARTEDILVLAELLASHGVKEDTQIDSRMYEHYLLKRFIPLNAAITFVLAYLSYYMVELHHPYVAILPGIAAYEYGGLAFLYHLIRNTDYWGTGSYWRAQETPALKRFLNRKKRRLDTAWKQELLAHFTSCQDELEGRKPLVRIDASAGPAPLEEEEELEEPRHRQQQ